MVRALDKAVAMLTLSSAV